MITAFFRVQGGPWGWVDMHPHDAMSNFVAFCLGHANSHRENGSSLGMVP